MPKHKIEHTYTVSYVEEITDKELKEYGELMEDEPMTIQKYIQYQHSKLLDDGAEALEDADDRTFKANLKLLK
jgi:hypothetical protein